MDLSPEARAVIRRELWAKARELRLLIASEHQHQTKTAWESWQLYKADQAARAEQQLRDIELVLEELGDDSE